jgi:hypothetical protein
MISVAAIAAASACVLAASVPASATSLTERFDHHWSRAEGGDPYAYRPSVPLYYGDRNSGYWVPAEKMRSRYRRNLQLPPYAQAWGWNSRQWWYDHEGERREFSRDWRR